MISLLFNKHIFILLVTVFSKILAFLPQATYNLVPAKIWRVTIHTLKKNQVSLCHGNERKEQTQKELIINSKLDDSDIVRSLGFNCLNKMIRKDRIHCSGVTDIHSEYSSPSTTRVTGETYFGKSGMRLIIAGAPASGKGTQCNIIKETYGVVHLSTGDMLRAAVTTGCKVGKFAKAYMDSGKLVPDVAIIDLVTDRLSEEDCKENGWLLDGFPRTRAQASSLAEAGVFADCFIFLNVSHAILLERIIGRRTDPETGKIYHMTFSPPEDDEVKARLVQRSDDMEEMVKVRLDEFHANIDDVKRCYSDILMEIDGSATPEKVAGTIRAAISFQMSSEKKQ